MAKRCMNIAGGPPAQGPYSHVVAAGGFLFVSGMGPVACDGSGVKRGALEEEARLTLNNLKTVLEGAGASLSDVVKTTVYLADMNQFAAFNAVYKEFFTENFPARTCIQAGRLPMDFQVEIEAIAVAR